MLGSLKDMAVRALAMDVGVGLGLAMGVDWEEAESRGGKEPKDARWKESGNLFPDETPDTDRCNATETAHFQTYEDDDPSPPDGGLIPHPIDSDHGAMAMGPHIDTPVINADMPLPPPPYVGACDMASAEQDTATTIQPSLEPAQLPMHTGNAAPTPPGANSGSMPAASSPGGGERETPRSRISCRCKIFAWSAQA